jgi:hypothetical protein
MSDPNRAPKTLLKITGVLAVLFVLLFACSCGTLTFWMMLGSPWPIDFAAFAE